MRTICPASSNVFRSSRNHMIIYCILLCPNTMSVLPFVLSPIPPSLAGCGVGLEGARGLAEVLRVKSTLTSLDVSSELPAPAYTSFLLLLLLSLKCYRLIRNCNFLRSLDALLAVGSALISLPFLLHLHSLFFANRQQNRQQWRELACRRARGKFHAHVPRPEP